MSLFPPDPLSTSALLAESAWLHRLALRLVMESSGADDAAQETLVQALERPPDARVPLRAWLAAVLRNAVRQGKRRDGRRATRELARPVELEDEPTDELAARLELHGQLLQAVRGLREPYRTTVALRFLEDLPASAVAERLGVPVKTVHTRLERALVELRERLDRQHGGRAAWAALLLPSSLPLPAHVASGSAILAPLLTMGTLWKWTCACGALVLLGYFAIPHRPASEAGEPAAPIPAPGVTVLREAAAPEMPVPALPTSERAPLEVAHPNPTPVTLEAPEVPAVRRFAGRVIDLERRGVAGLVVRFVNTAYENQPAPATAEESTTLSAADGAFELPLPSERGRLLADGRGYATVIAPGLDGEMPPEPPLVIVANAHEYGGVLLDVRGAPLVGIELQVRLPRERAQTLRPGALTDAVPLARTTTDASGRFHLADVAFVDGVALEAAAGGFERLHRALPSEDDLDLRLVLQALDAASALAGSVRFADGRPASGAWVAAGSVTTRALEDGSFVLELESGVTPETLRAVQRDNLPAELDLTRIPREQWQTLVLEIAAPALTLSGKVVDGEGRPLAGAEVWTSQGVPFGMLNRRFGETDFYVQTTVEEVIASRDDSWRDGRSTRTDGDGRFSLRGLLDRDYNLLAMHPLTQEVVELAAVPAGRGSVTLVLKGVEPAREVRGRVLNLAGEPVVGALLRVYRQIRLADGSQAFKQVNMDFHAVTDAQGNFRFAGLCVTGTNLLLNGETIAAPEARPLEQEPDLLNILFRAPAACHLRVFVEPDRADGLQLLDENGRTLSLTFLVGSVSLGAEVVSIEGGVSDLIRTDESARTLVLSKGGQESERIPIRLKAGEVNEIRP